MPTIPHQTNTFVIPRGKIGLTWGRPKDAPAAWRLGIFCVFRRGKSPIDGSFFIPRSGANIYPQVVVISLRALLPWAALFTLLLYLAGAAFVHARLARDPFNRVGYLDIAAPWNWPDIPRLRGESMLANGKDAHKRGEYGEALFLLGLGLERSPSDEDARIRLASLYTLIGRRDLADTTLLGGLDHGTAGSDFIARALPPLRESDRPDQLLEFCQKAESLPDMSASSIAALIEARCNALIDLGRHNEARALLSEKGRLPIATSLRLLVQVELSAENHEAAYIAAHSWLSKSPGSAEAQVVLIDLCRRTNRAEEMDQHINSLRQSYPTKPGFAAMAVAQNLLANRKQQAEDAWNYLVLRFGSDVTTMEGLARDLGKINAFEMLDRVERHLIELGIDPQNVWFSRLNAQLDLGDWEAARATVGRLLEREKKLSEPLAIFAHTASSVAEYALTGAPVAKSNIMESLSKSPGRLRLYLLVFDWLAKSGRWEGAADVLVLAEGAYPRSRKIEERRQRVAPLMDASETAKKRAVEQGTSRTAFAGAYPSPDKFVAEVDSLLGRGDHEGALRTINHLRRENPDWLANVTEDVDRREMLAVLALNDLPRIKVTAHRYLSDGPTARREACCTWAEAAFAEDHKSTARILVNEVLRREPDNKSALALLVRWRKDSPEQEP